MIRLLNKYKQLSLPVKASLWFTVCAFLQKGISMITTPIFTRVMSTDQYGVYSTYTAWSSVLILIVALALEKSIMNLYVKYEDKKKVLSSVLGLSLTVSCLWFIVYIIFHNTISNWLRLPDVIVMCMFISFIFAPAITCWSLYKRYIYDYKKVIQLTLFLTVVSSIVSVLAVITSKQKVEAKIISEVIITAIAGLFIYIRCFKSYKNYYNTHIWQFSLGFCVPLLPHYLAEFVLDRSDRLMINYMCSSSDVAIYSVAYSFSSLILLFTNAINSSFAPFQYQKIQSKEYKKLAKVGDQVLILIAVLLIVIMLFGPEIILIFGGRKYNDAVNLIPPLSLGIYFNYMFQLFARVQEYFEKKMNVTIASILCAALNIILNVLLITKYGYRAAAYTTFICYLIFCMVHYLFYRKVCKQCLNGETIYNIKNIIMLSLIVIICAFFVLFLYGYPSIRIAIVVIGIITLLIKKKYFLDIVNSMS